MLLLFVLLYGFDGKLLLRHRLVLCFWIFGNGKLSLLGTAGALSHLLTYVRFEQQLRELLHFSIKFCLVCVPWSLNLFRFLFLFDKLRSLRGLKEL